MFFFGSEYIIRVWSAGCRAKFKGYIGRLHFMMTPISLIDLFVVLVPSITIGLHISGQIGLANPGKSEMIKKRTKQNKRNLLFSSSCDSITIPSVQVNYFSLRNSYSNFRIIRFFQILRMLHVDRKADSWKLLLNVAYLHRIELITTMYMGFIILITTSYLVYVAERDYIIDGKRPFESYADALWFGIVTGEKYRLTMKTIC